MVTINYEPLEHLPYIDTNISPEERANVEQLIRLEMANQFNNNMSNLTNRTSTTSHDVSHSQVITNIGNDSISNENLPLHPGIDRLFPRDQQLQPTSSLNVNPQHYQEEEENESDDMEDDDQKEPAHLNSIDLERYSNFENEPINYNNLYATLGYSAIHGKQLELLLQNKAELNNLQMDNLNELDDLKNDLQMNINKKRIMIDEVQLQRKKRQLNDFKPYNDYYDEKWKQGITSAITASIEIAKNRFN